MPIPTKDAPILEEKPRGALSMLYWLKQDPAYNAVFHMDELGTMEKYFGIPRDSEMAQIMLKIGDNTERDYEERKKEMKRLFMELCEKYVFEDLISPDPQPFW